MTFMATSTWCAPAHPWKSTSPPLKKRELRHDSRSEVPHRTEQQKDSPSCSLSQALFMMWIRCLRFQTLCTNTCSCLETTLHCWSLPALKTHFIC
uniref:Uncharacterized protein n=1 Tax=Anguilla anguilla TaxID=7936 RepID=A0A0E9WP32_ANGAN